MAPNKIENKFREQLNNRTIEPTAGSWEQLSNKLDASRKKERKAYGWLAAAASVLAGILILSLVFNSTKVETTPEIVNLPLRDAGEQKTQQAAPERDTPSREAVATEEAPDEAAPRTEKVPQVDRELRESPMLASDPGEQIRIQDLTEMEGNSAGGIHQASIDKKLEEVLAEIAAREEAQGDATDREIEQLLYNAAVAISLEEGSRDFTKTIGAEALLYEVEMEIEQPFREKVFEILKDGYIKAKTAVANRNFQ